MVAIALVSYAILAWLRPRYAVGVLLFLIPFGHLVRFTVAGIPFTFPEFATYMLVGIIAIHTLSSSFRGHAEESHPVVPPNNGVRSLVGRGLLGTTRWWRDPWFLLPLLWILVAAIAAFGSPASARAWGIWKAYFLAPVVMFFVIRHLLRGAEASSGGNHESRIKNQGDDRNSIIHNSLFIILPLAAGAAMVAALAIAQRWWPIGVPYPWSAPGKFRATSVFGYPNAIGLYLAPIVPLFAGMALTAFRSLRGVARRSNLTRRDGHEIASPRPARLAMTVGLSAIAVLATIAIIFAKSTGALVALVVTIPVVALLVWRDRARRMAASPETIAVFNDRRKWRWCEARVCAAGIVTAWVVASLALTAWLPYRHQQPTWGPPIVQKLTFQKWSGSVRLSQYRETWQLLRDHPIRGAGLAGYQTAIAPYHEKKDVEIFLYPHNLLLAVWSELGLAGLLLFLAILHQFFWAYLSPLPTGRGSERGWGLRPCFIAAMLVLLVHGLVDVPYFKNDLAMLFWVIVAMGAGAAFEKSRAIT